MTSIASSLNVTIIGDGPRTIVFGNGLGTNQRTWRHQVDALRNDAKLVLFDYVGTPDSDLSAYRSERYDTIYGHADDVIAMFDELELEDVTFVGHSVGGMSRLVTVAASPRYIDDRDYVGGVSREMVDSVLANATADYHAWVSGFSPLVIGEEHDNTSNFVDEFSASLRRMRPDITNQTLKAIFLSDFRSILPRVKQPVAVIQPRADFVVPIVVGEYLASHFPSATLYLLSTVGHLPHLTSPDKVTNVLREVIGIAPPSEAATAVSR
jgi:sigma-B regulation protein RsbQ